MISAWRGACGLMSRNARTRSSSYRISAGISRATIFSKSVMGRRGASVDQQGAVRARTLCAPALAEEPDDLVADPDAARAPATDARDALRAWAQSVKPDQPGGAGEQRAQLAPQARVETQLETVP